MKGDQYFIYVGNAYPHKNLKRLIEAVVVLNKDGEQLIKLKIASSRNIFTQRLQRDVFKIKVSKFIELLGFVDDNKLRELYKNAVAFIFPSLSEGFGLPGIEAMRAGTLVLSSNITVFKEIYEDNAIYFNPFDFTSIENAMKKAIELSPSERDMRVEKGKEFAKKYSWRKMAVETLKIYEQFSK